MAFSSSCKQPRFAGLSGGPSRLYQQSDFHLNFLEPCFADKSIIDNTLEDIAHVIKHAECMWRDDILQLQALVASWCPAWDQKAEELLSDVGARTALRTNVPYLKLGHAVGLLSLMHQQLAKLQSDTIGFVLSPARASLSRTWPAWPLGRSVCLMFC